MIKNLFSEEYSWLQALRGDPPDDSDINNLFSSAIHLQYANEDDRQGQWTIHILKMWIRRMITTSLLPINHTITRTGDWNDLTIYDSNTVILRVWDIGISHHFLSNVYSNKAALCNRRFSKFWRVGHEVKGQASSVLGINTVDMLHLFNVPFQKWNRHGNLTVHTTPLEFDQS